MKRQRSPSSNYLCKIISLWGMLTHFWFFAFSSLVIKWVPGNFQSVPFTCTLTPSPTKEQMLPLLQITRMVEKQSKLSTRREKGGI